MTTNEKIKGIRLAILSAVCMGMLSFFEAATIAEGLAPSELALSQGVMGCIGFFAVLLLKRESVCLKALPFKKIFFAAIFMASTVYLMNRSYALLPSSTVICMHFSYPLLTTAAGVTLYREKVRKMTVLALALSFSGILLFLNAKANSALGSVMALASALMWTIYLMYVEHSGLAGVDPAAFNAFAMLFGLPVTLTLSLCAGDLGTGRLSAKTIFLLLALLVVNVVANLTLVSAVRCIGASLASAFSPLEPIVSAALGFLVLKDPFHVRSGLGCALVLLSVVLIALDNYRTGKSA